MNPERMEKLQVYGAPFSDDDVGLSLFADDYATLRSFIASLAADKLGVIVQFV
jgi:hypothetical protein